MADRSPGRRKAAANLQSHSTSNVCNVAQMAPCPLSGASKTSRRCARSNDRRRRAIVAALSDLPVYCAPSPKRLLCFPSFAGYSAVPSPVWERPTTTLSWPSSLEAKCLCPVKRSSAGRTRFLSLADETSAEWPDCQVVGQLKGGRGRLSQNRRRDGRVPLRSWGKHKRRLPGSGTVHGSLIGGNDGPRRGRRRAHLLDVFEAPERAAKPPSGRRCRH